MEPPAQIADGSISLDPYYLDDRKEWRFRYHPGQRAVMDSRRRFILTLAGTQSGKTVIGPWWLLREISLRGPGDYIIAAPSYPLMQKKVLPEFCDLYERRLRLGTYHKADRIFAFSDRGEKGAHGKASAPTKIFFGHAQDPESLESATAKAAWLDEAGQKKFRYGSWHAIERRLSIHEGRILVTTTPYTLGWLKSELHDRAASSLMDPSANTDVELVQFESTMNPAFPAAEYERQRERLPAWQFDMMYRGRFTRPAGMIYDEFSRDENTCPRFPVPATWPRYAGLDFGGNNTAAVLLAAELDNSVPTGRFFLYRTYYPQKARTSTAHAREITADEERLTAYGGAPSEHQWRREFHAGGLTVRRPPIKDVEPGINRVYALIKTRRLVIFDDLKDILDDVESYSRELDDEGRPTEKIEDKETYHLLDALRYIASHLARTDGAAAGAALTSFRGRGRPRPLVGHR